MLTPQHRYHIRARPKGGGGTWGQDLGPFLKNDILHSFRSRTDDLTHNVRAYVLDWVYTSALYTALKMIRHSKTTLPHVCMQSTLHCLF